MKRILWVIIAIAVLICLSEVSSIGVKATQAQEKPKPQIIERWECYDESQYRQWEFSQKLSRSPYSTLPREEKGPVLARLKRLKSGNFEYGEIEVSGSTQITMFTIQGINRRWDFGKDYKFAFVISPNKSGSYYDFRGSEGKRVKPSQFFICE